MQFDAYIVDAWPRDGDRAGDPVKFLVLRDIYTTAQAVSGTFTRQGWVVTGVSRVSTCDVLQRRGAPNAGRWLQARP